MVQTIAQYALLFVLALIAFHAVHRLAPDRIEFYAGCFVAGMVCMVAMRYLTDTAQNPVLALVVSLAAFWIYDWIQANWWRQ